MSGPTNSQGKSPYDPEKRPIEDHPIYAYGLALRALEEALIPHLVGGGLALARYGRARDTKDLDIFIHRRDAERTMNVLAAAGFTTLDTDLVWLRKAQMRDVFIDLILWSKGPIDLGADEVERGVQTIIDGVPIPVFAPEDLLLRKIYVMRDDGIDWLDAFSILEGVGPSLDWTLLERDGLDPLHLTGFLLTAAARREGTVPPHVIEQHLSRAQAALRERALQASPRA
jgi:hypothetical protein